jgi:hypothetical protein
MSRKSVFTYILLIIPLTATWHSLFLVVEIVSYSVKTQQYWCYDVEPIVNAYKIPQISIVFQLNTTNVLETQ